MSLFRNRWVRFIDEMRVAQFQGWDRPHKPMLVLLCLRRAKDGKPNRLRFSEAERTLTRWLSQVQKNRPEPLLPFWHLQADGFWKVESASELTSRAGKARPTLTAMRRADPSGKITDSLWQALVQDKDLIDELADHVITTRFQPGDHATVRRLTGF